MNNQNNIIIKGLNQNNLKKISLIIPKEKLAKYIRDKGNIYILDESTTGLHAKDIKKIMKLLDDFVEKRNTVIVIEHNLDVMKQADYIIDIGPAGGTNGGEVVFIGTPKEMIEKGKTITAKYLKKSCD